MASEGDVDKLYFKLKSDAESSGYYLNPDIEFTKDLVGGLITNEVRYGYPSCPCRLAGGNKEEDLDIICPCDYRDADLLEYDACYCALYVSQKAMKGKAEVRSIPERRPAKNVRGHKVISEDSKLPGKLSFPVWRCRVCGYICAREEAPEICPICKAKKERFERFI